MNTERATTYPQVCDVDSEQYVLGSVLREPDLFGRVKEALPVEAFLQPRNRIVYAAMLDLNDEGYLPDEILVGKRAKGFSYVSELKDVVGSTAFLDQHVRHLAEGHHTKEIIKAANEIAELGHKGNLTPDELVERFQRAAYAVSIRRGGKKVFHVSDVIADTMEDIGAWASGEIQAKMVTTGFEALDRILGGFQPGELVLLAGRPSHGKSQLALQIAMNAAVERKVLVVSLEMPKKSLTKRALVTAGNVDSMKIKQARLDDEDWKRLNRASASIAESGLYFLDDPMVSVAELRGICRRMKATDGLDLLIVDYLQLMTVEVGSNRNRQEEVAAISRGLKSLAMELEIPVMVLSQLSRGVEKRAQKRPMLSDLRESGSLEQDADFVLFVHHEKVKKDGVEEKRAFVIIGKYRDGKREEVRMAWRYGQWRNYAPEPGQEDFL